MNILRNIASRIKLLDQRLILFGLPVFIIPAYVTWLPIVPCGEGNPCTICHLFILLKNITFFVAFSLAPPVAGLLFLYSGILFLVSGGSQERITRARQIIFRTVLGLVLLYSSWLVINLIITTIAVSGFGGVNLEKWYFFQIRCK